MIEFSKPVTLKEKEDFFTESKLKYKDVARITGFTYDSVKDGFKPSNAGKYPRWFNLVLHVHNLNK
tara:strand:- start:821 stop:1018 length:198 start_codon:yes stop_codon:yes gene_type:complete